MAIRCASSGDRGRPPSRPLRGAEPTDLEPRGARDGAESEGARCRTFLVQIIPQRVGRTADSPKPPINPRTETGARHLNLTGAAAKPVGQVIGLNWPAKTARMKAAGNRVADLDARNTFANCRD